MRSFKNIIILLLLVGISFCQGQTLRGTLEKKMAQQYRIKILAMSPKGNWVIAGKHYDINKDTIEIFSTKNKIQKPHLLTKTLDIPIFLQEEAVVALAKDKAVLVSLNDRRQKVFDNIKRVFASSDTGTFALLNTADKLSVYNNKGASYYEIDSVVNITKDNVSKIFVVRKGENKYEIYDTSSQNKKKGIVKLKYIS